MGTWSSNIGKFKKKDPNEGRLWRWIKDNWKGFWEASIYTKKSCGGNCKCSCDDKKD